MELVLKINDEDVGVIIRPGDSLLKVLRGLGYFGVKHGCESGDCGACAVLLDGKPVNTCVTLAAQAAGHHLKTIESHHHPAVAPPGAQDGRGGLAAIRRAQTPGRQWGSQRTSPDV